MAGSATGQSARQAARIALPADAPFRDEMLQFAEADGRSPPPRCPIVFVGSSSIRLWGSLARDMAPLPVLNRGFGGSGIGDITRYFELVVGQYRPRAIVFYAGENDLDAGQSPAQVEELFRRFLNKKRRQLGEVPTFFISAKPSKLRLGQLERQTQWNASVRAIAERSRDLIYVDVVPAMMRAGKPRALFVEDGLHMAPAGYAIWADIVRRALLREKIAQRVCPD